MAFQEINTNTLIGFMSPQALSLAVNPGAVSLIGNTSGIVSIGHVRAPMPQGLARLLVTSSDAYGSGESLVILLRWQNSVGGTVTPTLATLDETTVPAAGVYEFEVDIGKIAPGETLSFSNTYVAGTPNNPNLSLLLQLY